MTPIRKYASLLLYALLFQIILIAQSSVLYIGPASNSLVISAGQPLAVSGLTLTPSSLISLNNNQITKGTTVTNPASLPYLPLVYRFTNTLPAYSGTITIDYSETTTGTMNEANFKFHYHNAVLWKRDGGSTVNTTAKTVMSSTITSTTLSEMTISDVAFALPATWLSFQASKESDKVRLNWVTASEENTSHFEPQHSTDGSHWRPLGRVAAALSSTTARNYSFLHDAPARGSIPNQYRILLRDLDGRESYSRIVTIFYNDTRADQPMYPNPVREILVFNAPAPTDARLLNAAGAVVWNGRFIGGRNELIVAHLAAGLYILETKTNQYRVVIQR